ncbi:MAG TPA: PQQ-binding-like beta-propeller repeat protein [Gemmatimonadaceae bacterium]|nr:PQQ-binding-like beta-propeller repeat protein [Gemmatimonadaceae bacterium]
MRRSALVLMLLAAPAPAAAQPAPTAGMFRGDPRHTGRYPGEGPRAFGGLLWRAQTGGPVRSSPTVAGDAVYVGSGDGRLYALDRLTGEERWRYDAGSAVASSAAVAGDAVFLTATDGSVHAVDRRTGRARWRVATGADAALPWGREGFDYYGSSPVVAGGLVVAGSGDGSLYALDAATGRRRWRFRTGGRVRSSPAVADGVVYVGSFDGHVYAVDLATGAERWRYATEGVALESARFGYDRRSVQSSPALGDSGALYVGSRDGHLYALDARRGTLRWKVAHDETSWSIASPALLDSAVIDASSDAHFIHAVRARDGAELWRVDAPTTVWSSPAVAGGSAAPVAYVGVGHYAGGGGGAVLALDGATGRELWRYLTGAPVLSSPAVAGGVLYVGAGDGAVYALRGAEGPGLARAVFWDSAAAALAQTRDHRRVRDYLTARGYELLDAARLAAWLRARLADRAPSVVVFAVDHAPAEVAPNGSDTVALRRYLDAGGKVVWLGTPPRMWPADSSGARSITGLDPAGASAILGVPLAGAVFDSYAARPTPAGARWGLSGWWLATWALDPAPAGVPGFTPLALDERRSAAAWVRRYGGPPGTGFVQLARTQWSDAALRELVAAAEYRPQE